MRLFQIERRGKAFGIARKWNIKTTTQKRFTAYCDREHKFKRKPQVKVNLQWKCILSFVLLMYNCNYLSVSFPVWTPTVRHTLSSVQFSQCGLSLAVIFTMSSHISHSVGVVRTIVWKATFREPHLQVQTNVNYKPFKIVKTTDC